MESINKNKKFKVNSNRFLTKNQKYYIQLEILKYLQLNNPAKYNKIKDCRKKSRCNTKPCLYCLDLKAYNNIKKTKSIINNTKKFMEYKHLIISIDNVNYIDIPTNLDTVNTTFNCFKRLTKFQKNSLGYIKKTEVSYNAKNNTYRPHLHLLLAFKKHQSKKGKGINNKYIRDALEKYYKGTNNLDISIYNITTDKYKNNIAKYIPKNNYRLVKDLVLSNNYKYLSTEIEQMQSLEKYLNISTEVMFGKWEMAISKNLKQYI